jgi:hypothetical protein
LKRERAERRGSVASRLVVAGFGLAVASGAAMAGCTKRGGEAQTGARMGDGAPVAVDVAEAAVPALDGGAGATDVAPAEAEAASVVEEPPGTFHGVRLTFLLEHRATAPSWLPFGPGGQRSERTWSPSEEILERMLAGLPERLEADRDGRGKEIAVRLRAQAGGEAPDASWDVYAGQIVGLEFDGRGLVYGNFFCAPERHEGVGAELVMVLDGGSCYFQVWFDPESGDYPRVTINGEA